MTDFQHYRVVAVRDDGARFVIAEKMTKDVAERLAEGMRGQGWDHQFNAECEKCSDPSAAARTGNAAAEVRRGDRGFRGNGPS